MRFTAPLVACCLFPLLLAACATERPPLHTPYGEGHRYGYQDLAVNDAGAEVRYIGPVRRMPNYAGRDAAVEGAVREAQELALLRAAELARQSGVRYFTVEQRRTDVNVQERVEYDPFPYPHYPYAYPGYYPYYHRYGYPYPFPPHYYRYNIGRVTVTLEAAWRSEPGKDTIDAAETVGRLRERYSLQRGRS